MIVSVTSLQRKSMFLIVNSPFAVPIRLFDNLTSPDEYPGG